MWDACAYSARANPRNFQGKGDLVDVQIKDSWESPLIHHLIPL